METPKTDKPQLHREYATIPPTRPPRFGICKWSCAPPNNHQISKSLSKRAIGIQWLLLPDAKGCSWGVAKLVANIHFATLSQRQPLKEILYPETMAMS